MTKGVRRLLVGVSVVVALLAAVWSYNWFSITQPINRVLAKDSRNEGIELSGHLRYYVVPSVLVLDLRSVSGDRSPADLMRTVFQTAAEFARRDRAFERVILAAGGEDRFYVQGEDFHKIGEEFNLGQNPVYLLRTFPEKLYRPDGSQAYGMWTGGLLGVTSKQMEELTDFVQAWLTPLYE